MNANFMNKYSVQKSTMLYDVDDDRDDDAENIFVNIHILITCADLCVYYSSPSQDFMYFLTIIASKKLRLLSLRAVFYSRCKPSELKFKKGQVASYEFNVPTVSHMKSTL